MALVELELNADGTGKVILDGIDISHMTQGVEFINDVTKYGNPNKLKVTIAPHQYDEFIRLVAEVKDVTFETKLVEDVGGH